MPFSIQQEANHVRLELEGELTIRHAAELAAAVAAIPLDSGIQVETAGLRDADTSVLQILCSLQRTTRQISFEPVSAGLAAAVDRCGLRRELLARGAAEGRGIA